MFSIYPELVPLVQTQTYLSKLLGAAERVTIGTMIIFSLVSTRGSVYTPELERLLRKKPNRAKNSSENNAFAKTPQRTTLLICLSGQNFKVSQHQTFKVSLGPLLSCTMMAWLFTTPNRQSKFPQSTTEVSQRVRKQRFCICAAHRHYE